MVEAAFISGFKKFRVKKILDPQKNVWLKEILSQQNIVSKKILGQKKNEFTYFYDKVDILFLYAEQFTDF